MDVNLYLLLALLATGLLKIEHIREKADFLLANMAFFFLPAGVSVIEMRDDRTLVLCVNAGGDLSDLIGSRPGHVVGGGDVARAK